MTKRAPLSKHWCFTINNPTPADGQLIEDSKDSFTYIVIGKETGDEGTPHMQGYCCFVNRKRRTAVAKVFPRAYLTIKRGTPLEAATYCKKDGDFLERGELPLTNQKRKTRDWDAFYESAKKGKLEDIPKDILMRYYHACKRIWQDNPDKPADLKRKQNYWVLAPTQFGKSHYVRKRWPDFYDKAPNKWFVGYKGEDTIICDDFGPKQCQYIGWYMKRWADLYAFCMETKGGGHQIRPKHIVITSQYSIEQCYGDDEKLCEAIKERFIVIKLLHWKHRINFEQVT